MRILVSSHAFAPSIGGIETVSRLLAEKFCRLGHDVVIVTQTTTRDPDLFPYRVVRRPSPGMLFQLAKWCDIFWQNNLSLRTLWPALVMRKPVVVTHQGSYCAKPSGLDLLQRLKHAVVRRLPSVAISQYVASCFAQHSSVIPNPYDADVFQVKSPPVTRDGIVFVGRLVSEKGVDVLLEALAELNKRGLRPHLTVVGSGPEEHRLATLVDNLGLNAQTTFRGAQSPEEVAAILNQHRILVVPSRYDEPFGVVALEGIACGCVAVASRGGGLPEAVGPCGITFPNGDSGALALALEKLLNQLAEQAQLRAQADQHLAQFHPHVVANAYLEIFRAQLTA